MDVTTIYEYLLSEYLFANGAISQDQRKIIDYRAAADFLSALSPDYLKLRSQFAPPPTSFVEMEAHVRGFNKKQSVTECNVAGDTDGATYSVPLHLWDRADEWKKKHASPLPIIDIARVLDDKGEIQKLPPKEPTELEKLAARVAVLEAALPSASVPPNSIVVNDNGALVAVPSASYAAAKRYVAECGLSVAPLTVVEYFEPYNITMLRKKPT